MSDPLKWEFTDGVSLHMVLGTELPFCRREASALNQSLNHLSRPTFNVLDLLFILCVCVCVSLVRQGLLLPRLASDFQCNQR